MSCQPQGPAFPTLQPKAALAGMQSRATEEEELQEPAPLLQPHSYVCVPQLENPAASDPAGLTPSTAGKGLTRSPVKRATFCHSVTSKTKATDVFPCACARTARLGRAGTRIPVQLHRLEKRRLRAASASFTTQLQKPSPARTTAAQNTVNWNSNTARKLKAFQSSSYPQLILQAAWFSS